MKRRYPTRSATRDTANSSGGEESTSAKRVRHSTTNSRSRKRTSKKEDQETAESKATLVFEQTASAITEESKNREGPSAAAGGGQQVQETTIYCLPSRILVKIFELLSLSTRIRIERVCRHWNVVSRLYAWSHTEKIDYMVVADDLLDLASSDEEDTDDEFQSRGYQIRRVRLAMLSSPRLANDSLRQLLVRSGAYLKSIDLSAYRDTIDYRVLRFVAQQCPSLESINLTGVLVTNTSLRSLAMGCPHLRSISFQRCFHDSVVDRGLSSLLANCRELTSLNLSENERVGGCCFDELPPTILRLELSACYELRDEAIRAVADRCQSLEVLHLDCCDRLSMDSLVYAFSRLPQLRVLRMNEFYVFADLPSPQAVAAMQTLNKLQHLTELYLNNNFLIDDTVVCAVSRGCPCLETLDISGGNKGLTDHSLISLGRFAYRTLKRLNISYLTRITNLGVKALSQCSQLRTLLLHRCENISDNGLMELAKCCHELRQLDVSFCHGVGNAAVMKFCIAREQLHRKLEAEKRSEAASGEGSGAESRKLSGKQPKPNGQSAPPGVIVIYAGATRVDKKLKANDWVKLNFRDGPNYGSWISLV